MKIILLQDVKGLGRKGDIKEVSEGYARNFLLARRLAQIADANSLKAVLEKKRVSAEKEKIDQEQCEKTAGQIRGVTIVMRAKEKDGRLFGSIHARDIVETAKQRQIFFDEKMIILESPIKKVGSYKIKIDFGRGVKADFILEVRGEK